jgi:hypothetical protein
MHSSSVLPPVTLASKQAVDNTDGLTQSLIWQLGINMQKLCHMHSRFMLRSKNTPVVLINDADGIVVKPKTLYEHG